MEIVASAIFALQFLLILSISMSLYYTMMRDRSTKRHTFHEFLHFAALQLGFTIPIAALGQYLQLIDPLLGSLVTLIIFIPGMVYIVRVWRYFWDAPGSTVFWRLLFASVIGGIIGTMFLFLLMSIFRISIAQPQ